jgi:ketosteroid isomerase-like protein
VTGEARAEIEEIVHRETLAWDTQDLDLLLSVFHRDMVWPWPPDPASHDPVDWIMPFGRFNAPRWRSNWEELFVTHELVHNRRSIVRIEVSEEGDGAFAVVDVDTLWRGRDGRDFHWLGRACKIYTKVGGAWKMIAHGFAELSAEMKALVCTLSAAGRAATARGRKPYPPA